MSRGRRRSRVILLFATLVVTGADRAGADDRNWTPFEYGAHREPVVTALADGRGPFRFIVDTGSTHSSISETLARTLAAPYVAKATVSSAAGEAIQPIVRVGRIGVGGLDAHDVLASVVPDETLDPGGRIHGIIGQDLLASRRFTIDFTERRIEWLAAAAASPAAGIAFRLRASHDRFVVDLPQADSTLALVPDSGADGLVLYARAGLRLAPVILLPGAVRLSTMTGERSARSGRLSELRIGDRALKDVPVVFVDGSRNDPTLGDGLLPLALFARATFDGPAGLLTLEPASH
jgi:predicted aspartyl protease